MPESQHPRVADFLTPEQERAAWERHYRESVLRGLDMTAAERFEWLEQMQATFAELHPDRAAEHRPPA